MPFEEMKPTKVEWWPLPREGEIVPDYPPQDITSCIASGGFSDGLDEGPGSTAADWAAANPSIGWQVGVEVMEKFIAEHGMRPMEPWQRQLLEGARDPGRIRFGVRVDAAAFERGLGAVRAALDALAHRIAQKRRLRIRRMHVLYRQRQLARRRRSR